MKITCKESNKSIRLHPGRSTLHAVEEVIREITTSLANPSNPLYAVFIDYSKDFDTINRRILIQNLENIIDKSSPELHTIKSVLDANPVVMYDGLSISEVIGKQEKSCKEIQ